jgi:enoyl-CoA hydratase/carnithine racemase
MRADQPLIQTSTHNGVRTLTLNTPKRLNGWTLPTMDRMKAELAAAAADAEVKAVVLTGTDPYYSAGVNLAGTIKLGAPRTLHAMIVEHNEALFNTFIDFPKPILVAVNGPTIGAAVTTATLCDGMIASEKATFSTPFAKLGVAAEGCSSVLFERLMGAEAAERMLGAEGWAPTGQEACDVGLAQWVAPHDALLDQAQAIAEGWVAEGRSRTLRGQATADELHAVNARESVQVADSFLSAPFLNGQFKFLWSRKKRGPALMFFALKTTRPVWSLFL